MPPGTCFRKVPDKRNDALPLTGFAGGFFTFVQNDGACLESHVD
jgi:hypothetical protein